METKFVDSTQIDTELLQKIFIAVQQSGSKKTGGYFSFYSEKSGVISLEKVGIPDPEKEEKYKTFALEKTQRILSNHQHRSMTSRNPDLLQWGGGTRYKNVISAFSGFTEYEDEAFSLLYNVTHEFKSLALENSKLKEVIASRIEGLYMNHYKDNDSIIDITSSFIMNF
jgi:hypothetical protein